MFDAGSAIAVVVVLYRLYDWLTDTIGDKEYRAHRCDDHSRRGHLARHDQNKRIPPSRTVVCMRDPFSASHEEVKVKSDRPERNPLRERVRCVICVFNQTQIYKTNEIPARPPANRKQKKQIF